MNSVASPLVSVGIATYNRPESLRRALECVINQTYSNLEILISEDCTPCTETKAIMLEYAARDPRIKCFHQKTNLGPPRNIRFVLEQATGEYFMWADDDDFRDLGWLEALLPKFNTPTTVIALGKVVSINETDEIVREFDALEFKGRRIRRLIKYFLAEERNGKSNVVCGLFKTSFLKNIKHWSQYKHNRYGGGDYLFVLDCVQNGNILVDSAVTIYKRLPVYSAEFLRNGPNILQRGWRQFIYLLTCIAILHNWLDKLILVLLLPIRIFNTFSHQASVYGDIAIRKFKMLFSRTEPSPRGE
ncbi:MAG TPA: glycosyltransferase family 2 protein [Methylophilaceae bacterium]|nr:glycosyltransferase family 2 protein [Methylophilaceae bacterium]